MINTKHWYFCLCIFLATCFGVFILPFLLPPPYLAGISAANVAGFNNKVASLAAAALGTIVFFAALKWPLVKQKPSDGDFGKLPARLVIAAVMLCGCMVAVFSYLVAFSGEHYGDGRYFMSQIMMYVDYGRKLYDQIEFTYGPLLFYGPVVMHKLLSPFHASTTDAYYVTLVLEHVIGLLLVVYVLDRLPILRRWKIVFLLLCFIHTYPFAFGLNYTFLRFVLPIAFLVLAARQARPWPSAACLFCGQAVSLAISPEMGFAFAASSIGYSAYCFFTSGRAWLLAVAAPFAATAAFLLLVGAGYLRILKLFARGTASFIVEPDPYILVFLFALIWLAPVMIARFFREARPEAPLLGALYVFSVALLPAALGRADPGHVFFDGFGIYLLSLVAISNLRPRPQVAWITCLVLILTWTAFVDARSYWHPLRARTRYDISRRRDDGMTRAAHAFAEKASPTAEKLIFSGDDRDFIDYEPFDLKGLQAMVGNDPVLLPLTVPVTVEEALKRSGQFVPTFYFFEWSVLDASAEERRVKEMNASRWALVPRGPLPTWTETPDSVGAWLGHRLPYHSGYRIKHEPYVIGQRFQENLQANWLPYGKVGRYEVYRRRD